MVDHGNMKSAFPKGIQALSKPVDVEMIQMLPVETIRQLLNEVKLELDDAYNLGNEETKDICLMKMSVKIDTIIQFMK